MNGRNFFLKPFLALFRTSIVAQPPDIDGIFFLFFLKHDYLVQNAFGQLVSFRVSAMSNNFKLFEQVKQKNYDYTPKSNR